MMRFLGLFIAILALVFLFTQVAINPTANQNNETQLEVMSAENAHLIRQLDPIGRGRIRDFLFSPDERWFAVRTPSAVFLYDTQNWQSEPRTLRVLDTTRAMIFSPNSQRLSITGCRGDVTDIYNSYPDYCEETETAEWNLSALDIAPRVYHHGQVSVRGLFYMIFDDEPLPVLVLATQYGLMLYQNAREEIRVNGNTQIGNVFISPDLRTLVTYSGGQLSAWSSLNWPQHYAEASTSFNTYIQGYPQILEFQFSADGQHFIMQSFDTNYIWNLEENLVEQIETNAIISPNMVYAIHRSDNEYELAHYPSESLNDIEKIDTLPSSYGSSELAFSPDSHYVIMGNSYLSGQDAEPSHILIWDIEAGEPKTVLQGNAHLYRFSPNMQLIAYTDENYQVNIYDLEHQTTVAQMNGYALETYGANFNENNEAVFASCSIYYAAGEGLTCLNSSLHIGNESVPVSIGFSYGNVILSPDTRYAILIGYPDILWDIENQRLVAELESNWLYNAAFSPNGRLFAVSGDPAEVFSLSEEGTVASLYKLEEESGTRINNLAFSPDGSLIATAQSDGTTRILDSESGIQLAILRSNQERKDELNWTNVDGVVFSPDGQWLASSVCTWDDGSAASYCLESDLQLWNIDQALEKGELLATEDARILHGVTDDMRRLVFSPNGELLVATGRGPTVEDSGNKQVYIWDVHSGELVNILPVNVTTQVTFSADGRLFIGNSSDGVVYRWGIPRTE